MVISFPTDKRTATNRAFAGVGEWGWNQSQGDVGTA